ncbi:Methyltransferase type 11 [Ancylobacter novellus DSM 506]|uniref:Methyltransferase type 11 n=1 Tax=Ancylobacter novellus (strain ATCC 8093 / DSM 506 / JCM 20403 / CCM 1077 / IAM 12100 / NBRC 12443 / NCIMB 10456) TaxID=639283 RepID=D6ZZI5_ANCN5|nr:methyltransferase [Ancylobacter novellus]ADH91180.1 Methyltransferase type 11 [Ancylobacter novellus DSM 506]
MDAGTRDAPSDAVLTDDIFLGGKLRLLQPARGHRAGHDAMLLAASAPGDARRAVDLGAGIGAAGLALAVRIEKAEVTLVEIDPVAAALAARNAARQQPDISARIAVVTADVAALGRPSGPTLPAARAADLVLMNPPFNDPARHRTSPHAAKALAHSVADGDLDIWLRAAERLLAPGGRLALIHRPEAMEAILAGMKGRFGAVTIRPVYATPDAPAIRVLVGAVKGRRTPPALLPGFVLADRDGRPSTEAERVLRRGEGIEAP